MYKKQVEQQELLITIYLMIKSFDLVLGMLNTSKKVKCLQIIAEVLIDKQQAEELESCLHFNF